MKLADIRKFALSLPGTSEAPHFKYTSFRVAGKIFATAPPDEAKVNIFIDEVDRDLALVQAPECVAKLFWGAKVVGVAVTLSAAKPALVKQLLKQSWRRKRVPSKKI